MRTLALLALLTRCAAAQQPPPDLSITPEERARIIEATADRMERYYVDAQKGREIAVALREALRRGPVSEARTALELVPPVNRILRSLGDRHLRFGYTHEPQAVSDEDAPETPAERAERLRQAQRNAYGIHGVQRLDGNVGLLTLAQFHHPDVAGDAVAAAMRLLHGTEALIIDLRTSAGGAPDMVMLLVTYLMPEGEAVLITSVENRYRGMTQQFWTLSDVPGPRYTGKDVYLLTSRRTWSAGEALTAHLRRLRRSIVVGDTTRGGARLSRWMPVHPNFSVSVSVGRHVGETVDWEGTGIAPDVVVPEGTALRTAHLLALRRLRDIAVEPDAKAALDEVISRVSRP